MALERITRKSLLYKSKVEYADFCINHVEGCSHGCIYPCYAMIASIRFGRHKDYKDWIKPKLVGNALELLDKEIPRYKDQINFVHMCFMTDPFMDQYPEVGELTLKIVEKLNKNEIKSTLLTKGTYPKNLIDKERYGYNNIYGITAVSLDEKFKKIYEPFSPLPRKRIVALKYLHDNGLKTWVSMEPYPTPNIVKQDLLELLEAVSFVDKIVFGKLNYNTQAGQFENNAEFYENCAETVIDFCKERNIDYHIKYGTKSKDDKKTKALFLESKV